MTRVDLEGVNGWQCLECGYSSKYKTNVVEHVDARHVTHSDVFCLTCGKLCPNRKSLRNHQYKYHHQKTADQISNM
jgi:hypothetical protein